MEKSPFESTMERHGVLLLVKIDNCHNNPEQVVVNN